MVCKKSFCSEFPDILEKLWRGRRRKQSNAMHFAFQANALTSVSKNMLKVNNKSTTMFLF